MDDEDRELINRLFATATAMLENSIEAAVAGQSPQLTPERLADYGHLLQVAAQDISIIAEAARIVAKLNINQPPDQQGRRL